MINIELEKVSEILNEAFRISLFERGVMGKIAFIDELSYVEGYEDIEQVTLYLVTKGDNIYDDGYYCLQGVEVLVKYVPEEYFFKNIKSFYSILISRMNSQIGLLETKSDELYERLGEALKDAREGDLLTLIADKIEFIYQILEPEAVFTHECKKLCALAYKLNFFSNTLLTSNGDLNKAYTETLKFTQCDDIRHLMLNIPYLEKINDSESDLRNETVAFEFLKSEIKKTIDLIREIVSSNVD